ncbi:lipopolysaccharide biosynthesis protein [Rhodomicrobium vannielii ATCC 17100]|uniref:Lipopolysaccharide biosynthesis protein n=1 Tax=Rhodomicrobium vannielii (strain ATCC 17100 / DSM 162 / LMG 4299 / NCIMB 10020 / ATH 3.1.1) TaxID=648757 RepID=E3I190_RHOVT|nr:GNVR domain-containing protein [Rhodomicrobium vannielii]ADP70103.1 lipopolysaccharide biosynthesis protein [Rhodomicrobium vannielii ATCC 17100]
MHDVVAQSDDREINFRKILAALFANVRLVLAAAGTGVVLAVLLILVSNPVYKATAKVLIDTRQQNILSSEELVKSAIFDTSAIDTQVELLTSGSVARRALADLSEKSAPGEMKRQTFTDKEIRAFLANLSVARKGLTYVLDVTFAARNAAEAANAANVIVKAYIDEAASADMNAAQKANAWLQGRIKTLEPEVIRLEKQIQDYKAVNGLVSLGEQTVEERNLVEYIGQLGLAKAALAEAQAKRDLDQSKSAMSLQSQDAYSIARTKVSLMERGLETLRAEVVNRREKELQLQEMNREATAAKELYASLLKRQREIEAQESRSAAYARVVQEALPPAWPSWPPKALLLLAGAFIGFVAGTLLVVARLVARFRGITLRSLRLALDGGTPHAPPAGRNA